MASEIIIYSDGASSGNPGPGGYGVVLISGKHRLEKSEGFRLTTNNRMELLGVITGLEALKKGNSKVVVYTDSKYVVDAVEKGWVFMWESKGFKKKKNPDLWIRFLKIYRKHTVKFIWIKGHACNPENEICDRLAVEASKSSVLTEDAGFTPGSEDNMLF
ncbi:MAG: ribonuclease HI [Bacteroidales bacterium]|jgi:ribonuclease HI|nr:ribonuclease HI [Bacteroidales bacterium]